MHDGGKKMDEWWTMEVGWGKMVESREDWEKYGIYTQEGDAGSFPQDVTMVSVGKEPELDPGKRSRFCRAFGRSVQVTATGSGPRDGRSRASCPESSLPKR